MQFVGYHHSISPVEKVLPKLLEKVLASGQRAVVMAESDESLKTIDSFLWTYSKSELLPHGTAEDGNAPLQPIWLTCTLENPNHANVLILVGALQPVNLTGFEKVLLIAPAWTPSMVDWAKTQSPDVVLWEEQLSGGWGKAQI